MGIDIQLPRYDAYLNFNVSRVSLVHDFDVLKKLNIGALGSGDIPRSRVLRTVASVVS